MFELVFLLTPNSRADWMLKTPIPDVVLEDVAKTGRFKGTLKLLREYRDDVEAPVESG